MDCWPGFTVGHFTYPGLAEIIHAAPVTIFDPGKVRCRPPAGAWYQMQKTTGHRFHGR